MRVRERERERKRERKRERERETLLVGACWSRISIDGALVVRVDAIGSYYWTCLVG